MLNDRYSVQAQKQIRKIDWDISKKIIERIRELTTCPLPSETKRCKEEHFRENLFLIPINNYEVTYELDFSERLLLIIKIEEIKKAERICSQCLATFCDY